jgi:catalase (peroxidase I)
MVFASNSILGSCAKIYAQDDSRAMIAHDFVGAWVTAMNADRFDIVAG